MAEENKNSNQNKKTFLKKWIDELESEYDRSKEQSDTDLVDHPEKIDTLKWAMKQLEQLESNYGYDD